MRNKKREDTKNATQNSNLSGFAILEQGLRIASIIIKIAIQIMVPNGKHIYDPGVIF